MDLFTKCDGLAIVTKGGVFYQRNLFRRGVSLFVQQGSGFVRLRSGGETTVPKLRWIALHVRQRVAVEKYGYLALHDGKNAAQKIETVNVFVSAAD